MHRDVVDMMDFYDRSRLGQHAGRVLQQALRGLWRDTRGMAVAGYGFAPPVLDPYRREAASVIALMPAEQGVCRWPEGAANAAALVEDGHLPLATGGVDRLAVLHGYEHAARPDGLMRELHRVLAPGGRAAFLVPNRTGLWARSDTVPFGAGHPYTSGQMRRALRRHGFDPRAETAALYSPPFQSQFWLRSARTLERLGERLGPRRLAGVLLVEAVKLVYVRPDADPHPVRDLVEAIEGIAAPVPKPATGRRAGP